MSMTPIASTTLTGDTATVTFTSISSAYKSLYLVAWTHGVGATGVNTIKTVINGVSTAGSYEFQYLEWRETSGSVASSNSAGAWFGNIYTAHSGSNQNLKSGIRYWFPAYSYTLNSHTGMSINNPHRNYSADENRGAWYVVKNDQVTTAITSLTFTTDSSGGFTNGSVFNLYGVG